MHILVMLLLLVVVSSCGKTNSSAGMPEESKKEVEVLPLDGSNVQGIYLAPFTTLNPQVNGTLPGSTTVMRTEEKFYTYVRLFAGAPKAWHQQNIYTGGRCPDLRDDLNKDGFIDVVEGQKVWGNILIPLDANTSTQAAGRNIYPLGDESGSYFYERVTNFQRMFADLKSADKDLEDNLAKLAPEAGLKMEGQVVVIQGVGEEAALPETVATVGRRAPYQTLPIACGVFHKVTKNPGELDSDIPGPIATPAPGDDVPSDGAPLPDGSSTPSDDGSTVGSESGSSTPTHPPVPRPHEEEDEGDWVNRVIDWWHDRWGTWRGHHEDLWGDGNGNSIFE